DCGIALAHGCFPYPASQCRIWKYILNTVKDHHILIRARKQVMQWFEEIFCSAGFNDAIQNAVTNGKAYPAAFITCKITPKGKRSCPGHGSYSRFICNMHSIIFTPQRNVVKTKIPYTGFG